MGTRFNPQQSRGTVYRWTVAPKAVSDKSQQGEEGGLDPGMSVSKAGAVSNKLTAPLNQNPDKLLRGSEPQFSHL